jgi:hypothetical protein
LSIKHLEISSVRPYAVRQIATAVKHFAFTLKKIDIGIQGPPTASDGAGLLTAIASCDQITDVRIVVGLVPLSLNFQFPLTLYNTTRHVDSSGAPPNAGPRHGWKPRMFADRVALTKRFDKFPNITVETDFSTIEDKYEQVWATDGPVPRDHPQDSWASPEDIVKILKRKGLLSLVVFGCKSLRQEHIKWVGPQMNRLYLAGDPSDLSWSDVDELMSKTSFLSPVVVGHAFNKLATK